MSRFLQPCEHVRARRGVADVVAYSRHHLACRPVTWIGQASCFEGVEAGHRIHGQRQIQVGGARGIQAEERPGHDTDDGDRLSVYAYRSTDDGRISPIRSLPEAVTENGDGGALMLVLRADRSPEHRCRTHSPKVIVRDDVPFHASVVREIDIRAAPTGDIEKTTRALEDHAVRGIRKPANG